MSADYRDDLNTPDAFRQLWAQVLLVAIDDAIKGPALGHMSRTQRLIHIDQARSYFTKPNPDFIEVCSLAGLEPDAVRARAVALIEQAPSADELAGAPDPIRKPKHRTRTRQPAKLYTVGDTSLPMSGWAARLGVSPGSIYNRLSTGWTVEEALTTPKGHQRQNETVH